MYFKLLLRGERGKNGNKIFITYYFVLFMSHNSFNYFRCSDIAFHISLSVQRLYGRDCSLASRLIIISVISSLESAHHSPLLDLGLFNSSLDLRLLASSSCQPFSAKRHSTWPEGVLPYVHPTAMFPFQLRFH
jgi:hypothetical protein